MNEDNKIFKTNEISIEISPVKNTVDSQRAQYYSYDENSGIQRIHILKDGQPLGLPEGSEIRLSAVKLSGSKQMMVYTPEIEDRVKGIVTFVIPKEFLGYSGQIRCTLYIDFSSDQTLHAGYFYINMGISDIDANLPEFSESYWQGWAEFQEEAEAAWSEWQANREYDWTQWTTAQQAKQDAFETATNAQMSTVKQELVKAQDDIDQIQEDIASGKVVTENKLVDYWTGEPIVLEGVANYVGKEANSTVENPHYFGRNGATTSLVLPTGLWSEASQSQYGNLEKLDGKVAVLDGRQDAGYYAQNINKWNLIEQINRDYPKLYESVGANDLAAKVAFVKKVLTSFEMTAYGRGSGPTGNKVTSVIWDGAAWVYAHTTTAGTITKLGYRLTDPRFLNDDGFMYNLIYAGPSDGTTASSVSIDTAQLTYSLKLNLYDFVPKKSDIYDKTQADQRFVSLSENQTVGGVKNYLERPQLNGNGLIASGEVQMSKITTDNGGAILSMDNSKTFLQWIADAGWGIRSCYMTADVVGGTGFSGRGLIVNSESDIYGAGYILINRANTLDYNSGLLVRHFTPDLSNNGALMWTSDWLRCGSVNKTRLTPTSNGVAAGQTIQLSKDVRNFSMLNVCTGGVSDGANIIQSISPYVDGTWRPAADGSMDRWGVLTADGTRVILILTSYTTLEVVSTPAGAAGIRYIDGIM